MEDYLGYLPSSGNSRNIFISKAPGRMDVMGGIADYSGAHVLQMPIREQANVSVCFIVEEVLRIYSFEEKRLFEIPIHELPTDYEQARLFLKKQEEGNWAAYIVGCLLVLAKEKGIELRGIDFALHSDVPIGKGVSSSAAIEIATMRALAQLYSIDFQGTEMARLAQRAENLVVGSPCGLMDQLASCFGQPGYLLPIQCQPDRLQTPLKIPEGIAFLGIDSGVRHAVSGASYTDVRTAAFMGYRIIAQAEGCSVADIREARRSGNATGLPFCGYLCNIPPSVFEKKYAALFPENLSGKAFLAQYGDTTDLVTQVKSHTIYQVKNCTRHPVYENFRVQAFAALLQQPPMPETLALLGELMFQSHESYTTCGLGNVQTDAIVEMVRSAGVECGVFGAKITGGGSGGTVCVGCYEMEGILSTKRIFEEYQAFCGMEVKLID